MVNDSPTDPTLQPKHLTKQEFGKRLYRLMLGKGWSQSELARQAGLPRDAISVYIRGKSLPTAVNLAALAKTFGVQEYELLPNHAESAIDEDNPAFEMKVSPSAPNVAWVRVNRMVSLSTAVKIAELLENDRVNDRARSGDAPSVQSVED
jgi:transcriptional regulator with XRE-family HTH domain